MYTSSQSLIGIHMAADTRTDTSSCITCLLLECSMNKGTLNIVDACGVQHRSATAESNMRSVISSASFVAAFFLASFAGSKCDVFKAT